MDVNGTRFHLLLGRRDWQPVIEQSTARLEHALRWDASLASAAAPFAPLRWDEAFGGVSLSRQVPVLQPPRGVQPLSGDERRGAGADGYGNLFWIDADNARILVQPAGLTRAGEFWSVSALAPEPPAALRGPFAPQAPASAPALPALRGLAVTTTHYLVAGTLAPGGLLLFDLHAAGAPCWWRWPEAIGLRPFDIAASPDGGVVILDRDEAGGTARLWRLDRNFGVVASGAPLELAPARRADFFPEGGAPLTRPAEIFPGPVNLASATVLDVEEPVGVIALPDGSVLVLDAGAPGEPSRIHRYRGADPTSSTVLDAQLLRPQLDAPITAAHAFAALLDARPEPGICSGRLFIVTRSRTQVFALRFAADGDAFWVALEPVALPLQSYSGKGLVASGAEVFYDLGDRWIALAEQPRYRYFPEAASAGPALQFDGKQAGCIWHRVLLDACIPPGCEIEVWSRAADERDLLDASLWRREPTPSRRSDGSELPFDRPFGAQAPSDAHTGTFETLFQETVGRHLQLRLVLRGNGRASPRLRALRVYYPRFSYLHEYLPAVYREDRTSASFLERWLCNVEGSLTALEGRIERAEILFDPASAPPEYLEWLAGWLGAMLDPNWDEDRRRLFVGHAWLLFRWRGTAIALLAFLRLATDFCPDSSLFAPLRTGARSETGAYGGASLRIVENFELRRYPALLLGDTSAPAPGVAAEQVRWKPSLGGAQLHALYARWLRLRYRSREDEPEAAALARLNAAWQLATPLVGFEQVRFSPVIPAGEVKARDWESFAAAAFDFAYPSVRAEDAARWREFLAQRYAQVDALNQAWGRTGSARWSAFAAVPLPAEEELPADGAPLDDWIAFVSTALAITRNAHRFTVLVPALQGEPQQQREQRLARVRAIVETEKPAHTAFEARLFWALFQVGSARLGVDTVLGEGSRFVAVVLDAGHLGEGYLAGGHPWSATDRRVIGRDRLQG
jgi:phage tail-like protein